MNADLWRQLLRALETDPGSLTDFFLSDAPEVGLLNEVGERERSRKPPNKFNARALAIIMVAPAPKLEAALENCVGTP